ncbi:MAG: hypothetical protein AAGC57_14465 [Pseudomonadota bacterium]
MSAELARQWTLVRTDLATRKMLEAEGFDLAVLDAIEAPPFEAEAEAEAERAGNNFDVTTTILIGIAVGVGTEIGKEAVGELRRRVFRREIENQVSPKSRLTRPRLGSQWLVPMDIRFDPCGQEIRPPYLKALSWRIIHMFVDAQRATELQG